MSNLKDTFTKIGTGVHRGIFTASKGRVLGKISGMPGVQLTTTGRRSGKTRKTMLASPIQTDGRVVVVASYNGAPRHPAWYLNLCSNPEVTLTIAGRDPQPMVARTATAEERAELWPRIVQVGDSYARYQAKTRREIPVVILTPK
ncbi:MAG TPA: nitroreductase/quinone reductase family protein [Acidimicrobiales bacterium]|nr:nitroreductase/quinone reductase family protein [Acidimicrobiales bacterium]